MVNKRKFLLLFSMLLLVFLVSACRSRDVKIIESASINNQGQLVIEYSDGSTETVGNVVGPQGPQGPAGQAGAAGADGVDGAPGAAGQDGAVGPAGPQGTQGAIGETGPQGVTGPSATASSGYDSYRDNNPNYTKPILDWLIDLEQSRLSRTDETDVLTAAQLVAALADSSVAKIRLQASMTPAAVLVINRPVQIELNGYQIFGDVAVTQSAVAGDVTILAMRSLSNEEQSNIVGEISIDAPNLSFTIALPSDNTVTSVELIAAADYAVNVDSTENGLPVIPEALVVPLNGVTVSGITMTGITLSAVLDPHVGGELPDVEFTWYEIDGETATQIATGSTLFIGASLEGKSLRVDAVGSGLYSGTVFSNAFGPMDPSDNTALQTIFDEAPTSISGGDGSNITGAIIIWDVEVGYTQETISASHLVPVFASNSQLFTSLSPSAVATANSPLTPGGVSVYFASVTAYDGSVAYYELRIHRAAPALVTVEDFEVADKVANADGSADLTITVPVKESAGQDTEDLTVELEIFRGSTSVTTVSITSAAINNETKNFVFNTGVDAPGLYTALITVSVNNVVGTVTPKAVDFVITPGAVVAEGPTDGSLTIKLTNVITDASIQIFNNTNVAIGSAVVSPGDTLEITLPANEHGMGYYAVQTINGVASLASNAVNVITPSTLTLPNTVGGYNLPSEIFSNVTEVGFNLGIDGATPTGLLVEVLITGPSDYVYSTSLSSLVPVVSATNAVTLTGITAMTVPGTYTINVTANAVSAELKSFTETFVVEPNAPTASHPENSYLEILATNLVEGAFIEVYESNGTTKVTDVQGVTASATGAVTLVVPISGNFVVRQTINGAHKNSLPVTVSAPAVLTIPSFTDQFADQVVPRLATEASLTVNVATQTASALTVDMVIVLPDGSTSTPTGTLATDRLGNVAVTFSAVQFNLPGTYHVLVTAAAANAKLVTGAASFVLSPTTVSAVQGPLDGTQQIIVSDALNGALITVLDDSTVVVTGTASASGTITFDDIPVKNGYTVTQTVNDAASALSAPVNVSQPAVLSVGTVTISGTALGSSERELVFSTGMSATPNSITLQSNSVTAKDVTVSFAVNGFTYSTILTANVTSGAKTLNFPAFPLPEPGRYHVVFTISSPDAKNITAGGFIVVSPTVVNVSVSAQTVNVTGAFANATVTLYDSADKVVATATASSTGEASFASVAFGAGYYVTQTFGGVESAKSSEVSVVGTVPALEIASVSINESGQVVVSLTERSGVAPTNLSIHVRALGVEGKEQTLSAQTLAAFGTNVAYTTSTLNLAAGTYSIDVIVSATNVPTQRITLILTSEVGPT